MKNPELLASLFVAVLKEMSFFSDTKFKNIMPKIFCHALVVRISFFFIIYIFFITSKEETTRHNMFDFFF